MKDLHCHLLYGIDDGSSTIDESIELIKESKKQGIDEFILTPHYIENSKYMCDNKDKEKLYKELVKRVKKEKIDVKLYLGNEVFFTSNMIPLIKDKKIQTLNKSKYVLFEFPMNHIYTNTSVVINELVSNGYIPVLAHPERYRAFQEHKDLAEEYLRCGVLLQINFTSLFGKYGSRAKKLAKYYLKKKWVTFVGSDTHHDIKFDYNKLYKKIKKLSKDEEYTDNVLNNNFDKVINNEDLGILR